MDKNSNTPGKPDNKKAVLTPRNPFFVLGVCMGVLAIIIILLLPAIAKTPQVYNELIMSDLAYYNVNKSGELSLFWCCLALGMALLFLLTYKRNKNEIISDNSESSSSLFAAMSLLIIPVALRFIVYYNASLFFVLLAVGYLYFYRTRGEMAFRAAVLIALVWYTLIGIFSAAALLFAPFKTSEGLHVIVTAIVSAILLYFFAEKGTNEKLDRLIAFIQCVIPLSLLIYIRHRYSYQGEYVSILQPVGYIGFIIAIIAASTVYAVLKAKKYDYASEAAHKMLIIPTTVIIILIVNSVNAVDRTSITMFFPTDWHHTGERYVPWYQIIEQGRILYKNYFPPSGLFPMVDGFIHSMFGGTVTAFGATLAVWRILIAAATALLCYRFAGSKASFYIALFFFWPDYERYYLLMPSLLLLAFPAIIKNRSRWLQCWMLCTFANVLYYPSCGGAVFLGGLPFGIIQLVSYIRSGDIKIDLKKKSFYISWALCLLPVALSIPLLIRMARHIAIYSSQSIYADSLPIFGHVKPPNNFIPFIPYESAKKLIIYAVWFIIESLAPLLFFYIFILWRKNKTNIWEKLQTPLFYSLSSGFISILVCYSFTLNRQDSGGLTARSRYVIIPLTGVFLAANLWKYGADFLKNKQRYILIGFTVAFSALLGTPAVEGNIKGAAEVPKEYVRIDEPLLQEAPRAGEGFIRKDNYSKVLNLAEKYSDDRLRTYPTLVGNMLQLSVYLLDLKTSATAEFRFSRSYEAQREIIEIAQNEPPIFGEVPLSHDNYYIYRWFIDQEYSLTPNGLYMTPAMMLEIYGETYLSDKRTMPVYMRELRYMCSSLGRSMETLSNLFDKSINVNLKGLIRNQISESGIILPHDIWDPLYKLELPQPVSGLDADFLYLEMRHEPAEKSVSAIRDYFFPQPVRTIKIYWGCEEEAINEDQSFSFYMGDGKLLIPLGMYPKWLFSNNTVIRVDFEKGFSAGDTVVIEKAQLLQLNR